MPTQMLLRTAARHALGLADTLEIVGAADAALDRGVYSDGLGQLVTMPGLILHDAGLLFEKALRELEIPVLAREQAVRTLLLWYIGDLAETAVPPHDGLARLVRELYDPVRRWRGPLSGQEAEAYGLEPLIGSYWDYETAYFGYPEGPALRRAVEELDRAVIQQAASWLRDRSGVDIDRAWLTRDRGAVRRLAGAIRDERRFAELPLLADALAEAGCGDQDVLAHCREPGHAGERCWVLDLVLRKD